MEDFTLTIYKISRNTRNHYTSELKKNGITMGQFRFVMKIVENDGISQKKFSEMLFFAQALEKICCSSGEL